MAGRVAAEYHTIDLQRLALRSGEGRRLDFPADPGGLDLGGHRYRLTEVPIGQLDISRTVSGFAMRLRFDGELAGPCQRCLIDSRIPVAVDAREVDQPGGGEELTSPYVVDNVLDVAAWAHDAMALALPATLTCRPGCLGLCPVCGESLNDADPDEHRHDPGPDPRWDKLRELRIDQ